MNYEDRLVDELEDLYGRYFKLINLLPFIDELDCDDPAAMAEFNMTVAEMTATQAQIETRLEALLNATAKHLLFN